MQPKLTHSWDLTPKEAVELQHELAGRVRLTDGFHDRLRRVAGADIALEKTSDQGYVGIVVFELPGLEEIERVAVTGRVRFPYVPGLLSFREGPLLLEAFARLQTRPDFVMFDGQGIAHPRRFGLAAHVGLLLDLPSIGVGKSRLLGTHREPGQRKGSRAALKDGGETIGHVLRTRDGVKPVFVSPGHRVSLESAPGLVLSCCDGYRIPKPTRIADQHVGTLRRGPSR